MQHPISFYLLLWFYISVAVCQRYAERNPVPLEPVPEKTPFEDHYDDDYTEGYDFFEDDKNIYRWNVKDFPNPQENPRFCNRLKPSFVCDPDQVLQKDEADRLDAFIRELYKETPCICDECMKDDGGIVIGIALLKNMYQPYNQHPSKTIRSFAENLREMWKLGKCDNDILIVVATTDRLSFTDVGRATSTYVSLEEAHRIFLENKGHLSAGNFYEGLRAMLADYHTKTRTMKVLLKPEEKQSKAAVGLIAGIIVGAIALIGITMFIIIVIYRRCRRSKDPEKAEDGTDSKPESVSSSWTKRDFKFMFSSMKSHDKPHHSSAVYQPCETNEKEDPSPNDSNMEEEIIDTTLALPSNLDETQVTTTTSVDDSTTPEMLDRELTEAVEGISQTFHTFQPKREFRGHETDL